MERNENAADSSRGLSTQDLLEKQPDERRTDESARHSAMDSPTESRVEGRDETAAVPQSREAPGEESTDEPTPQLFADQEIQGFRAEWQEIQGAFVDDPQQAVREADELVAAVIQSLASTFAEHKTELESQWRQGEAPTEDLRVALFNQLLHT
jgi:HD-GYP domain-containing protein (c-di-GMP phosphodiesterase class II)